MLLAGFWGLVAGSALVLGALVGFYSRVPQRLIAGIMAFGGGVLISALSFDLMDEAYKRGGFDAAAIGFLGGAMLYTVANWLLAALVRNIGNAPAIMSRNLPKKIIRAAAWRSRSARYSTAFPNPSSLA